jgi:hypothetical protein
MKSFSAFSRRLMLSLLVAFWTTSLVYAIWRFIREEPNTPAMGLADLYLPSITGRCSNGLLLTIHIVLAVGTVTLALWEILNSTFHHTLAEPPSD